MLAPVIATSAERLVDSKAEWGAKMDNVRSVIGIYEPEMDMRRGGAYPPIGRMRRFWSTILSYRGKGVTIELPRRSIDRDQQEYSPRSY